LNPSTLSPPPAPSLAPLASFRPALSSAISRSCLPVPIRIKEPNAVHAERDCRRSRLNLSMTRRVLRTIPHPKL
jgi:hypothetical protein